MITHAVLTSWIVERFWKYSRALKSDRNPNSFGLSKSKPSPWWFCSTLSTPSYLSTALRSHLINCELPIMNIDLSLIDQVENQGERQARKTTKFAPRAKQRLPVISSLPSSSASSVVHYRSSMGMPFIMLGAWTTEKDHANSWREA